MNTRSFFQAGLMGIGLTLALSGPVALAKPGDPAGMPKPGMAGDRDNPRQGRMMMDRMAASLNLTPAQKRQFEANQNTLRTKMKTMRDGQDKRILAILTPQQAAKYRQARANREGGQGGPMMRGRLTDSLGLTPKQEEQIRTIRQANRDQMRNLRETSEKRMMAILTPAQAAKMKTMRASWGGRGPEGRRDRGQGGPGSNSLGKR